MSIRTYDGSPSGDYEIKRNRALPWGFIAVSGTHRHATVHIVKADTFGHVAKLVIRGKAPKTLCGRATVTPEWTLVPRQPNNGYLLSCNNCRGALSHYRSSDDDAC